MCVVQAVDVAFGNTVVSALVCYLVDRLLVAIRGHWGRINVSRKTLVDDRFLI